MKQISVWVIGGFMVMGTGCTTASPKPPQGCCTNVRYNGRCMPSHMVANQLECLPLSPAISHCVADPFQCDKLRKAIPDNCWRRNPQTGYDTSCYREVGISGWDPYGHCANNQCVH